MQTTRPASIFTAPAPLPGPVQAVIPTGVRFRRSVVPAALRALADEAERRERCITVAGWAADEDRGAA
jgi:hypothetical protein